MKRFFSALTAFVCIAAFALVGCTPPEQSGSEVYHTVTFDSCGGTAVQSQQVLDGNLARRPDTPLREGYFLRGWYEDAAATESEWDFDTDRVTGDITLYAGWTAEHDLDPTESLVYALNDAVFIGHPIWWGGAPRIIQTFIESYDFSDKQVYTFSTSASSSGSGALSALEREYPEINFVGNIHFTGSTLSSAQERVNAWIIELGFSA